MPSSLSGSGMPIKLNGEAPLVTCRNKRISVVRKFVWSIAESDCHL